MQPSPSRCLGLCLPQEGALGSASEGGFGLAQLGFLSLPADRQQPVARLGCSPSAQLLSRPVPTLAAALLSPWPAPPAPALELLAIPGVLAPPWGLDASSGRRLCRFLSLMSLRLKPSTGQTFQKVGLPREKTKQHTQEGFSEVKLPGAWPTDCGEEVVPS